MQLVYGDVTLGLHGHGFHYIFSYQTGGMESLVAYGKEWLYRTPKPTFWRATTDNDRGSGFPLKSGMWLSADLFIRCKAIEVLVDDNVIPLPIAPENNRYHAEEYAQKGSRTSISHFYDKCLKLKDKMNTDTAKEIAKERHKYLENFLEEFFEEWNGKK